MAYIWHTYGNIIYIMIFSWHRSLKLVKLNGYPLRLHEWDETDHQGGKLGAWHGWAKRINVGNIRKPGTKP